MNAIIQPQRVLQVLQNGIEVVEIPEEEKQPGEADDALTSRSQSGSVQQKPGRQNQIDLDAVSLGSHLSLQASPEDMHMSGQTNKISPSGRSIPRSVRARIGYQVSELVQKQLDHVYEEDDSEEPLVNGDQK